VSAEPTPRWMLQQLDDVVPRQVRWLVHGLIPLRTLTLVAGVGGLGKSMWLLARAAELSRQGTDVIVVSFEDTAAEIIRPRVEAAGGDLSRIHVMVLADASGVDTVQLPRDLDNLRRLVQSVKARLVIVDPVVAAIETRLDAHKDQHVRHVLNQLTVLAQEEDAAAAIVGHLNKAPSTEAYIRVANSVAFWNASRSVVLITEDGDDDTSRLVAQRKANWARLRPVERHRLEEVILQDTLDPETGDPIVTSRIVFVEVADDVNGGDVLTPKTTKTETAETLLEAMLADGEWHESASVKMLMGAAGYAERTVQRAAKYLGVETERRGLAAAGTSQTWWRVPIPLGGASARALTTDPLAPSAPPKSGASVETAQPCGAADGQMSLAPDAEQAANGHAPSPWTDAEVADVLALQEEPWS
jgi:putative DNA primase/helicase